MDLLRRVMTGRTRARSVVGSGPCPLALLFCLLAGVLAVPPALFAGSGTDAWPGAPGARSARGGLGGTELFLGGNYIELGFSQWGDLGTEGAKPANFFGTLGGEVNPASGSNQIGMSADHDGFNRGRNLPIDYYLPGTPEERFAVGYRTGGSTFINSNSALMGAKNMSTVLTDQSDVGNGLLRAKIVSTWTGRMEISQTISFAVSNKFYRIDVVLKNLTSQTWTSTRYMRSFDPDNTQYRGGEFITANTVTHTFAADGKAVVKAETYLASDPLFIAFGSRMPFFFYSTHPSAKASVFGFSNSDPYAAEAYDSPSPKGTTVTSDVGITLTFELGTLNPGATKSFTFYCSLDERDFADIEEEFKVPNPLVLGTNEAVIASGEAASEPKGTVFPAIPWGQSVTNQFSITNSGQEALLISSSPLTGPGAAAYRVLGMPATVATGTVATFRIAFVPAFAQNFGAVLDINSNATNSPYRVFLSGVGVRRDQLISFPPIGEQVSTNVITLTASASSGLPVTFTVVSGPATLSDGTTLTMTGTGMVSVVASQAGNANWNAAPDVTNTFRVIPANLVPLVNSVSFDYGWYAKYSVFMFRFVVDFERDIQPSGGPLEVKGVWLTSPTGEVFEVFSHTNQSTFGDMAILEVPSYSGYGDDIPSDGEYTLLLQYADDSTFETVFWFGIPDTTDPLPMPDQYPVILDPIQGSVSESPVLFAWEPVTDETVNGVLVVTTGLYAPLESTATNYGPHSLRSGPHEVAVWFQRGYRSVVNPDGAPYQVSKSTSKVHTFDIEGEEEFTLSYDAGLGGSISGEVWQVVELHQDGTPVTAVPDDGLLFGGWDDGRTDNPRTDTNVTDHVTVYAWFKTQAGVPVEWYYDYGLTPGPGQTWSDLDDEDYDGDGATNSEEHGASTNPVLWGDAFRITGATVAPPRTFDFQSAFGVLYVLQASDHVVLDTWDDVPGLEPHVGVGGPDSITDPNVPPAGLFYRISIVPPQSP